MLLACCTSRAKEWERTETADLKRIKLTYHTSVTENPFTKSDLMKSILFVQTQPEMAEEGASPALVPELPKTAIDPAQKKEIPASVPVIKQPADEIPSPVLVPQTFRLPQRLIEDLARAGELRALSWLDREGNTWLPIGSKSTVP
jgi:hypothetical protein